MDKTKELADRLLKRAEADPSLKTFMDDVVDRARSRMRLLRAYDARAVGRATRVCCEGEESRVQQHLADEVDINTICRRFGLSPVNAPPVEGGVYGDFSGITDFESAVEAVKRAQRSFNALPAEVRDRFKNDPGRFLRETAELDDEELDAVIPVAEPERVTTLDDVVQAVRESREPPAAE